MAEKIFSNRLFKLFWKFVSPLIIVVIAYFILKVFLSDINGAGQAFLQIGWFNLALATVLYLISFYTRAFAWNFVVDTFGYDLKLKDKLFSWFAGESARYVPGNVWSFLGRYFLTRRKGVTRLHTVTAITLEILILLAVTSLLSVPAFIFNYQKLGPHFSFLVTIGILSIAGIAAFLLQSQIRKVIKILNKIPKETFVSNKFLMAAIFMIITWICFGLGTFALISPFLDSGNFFIVVSTFILAWLIGYLSFITPMGLGVREEAIILLVGSYVTTTEASVVAVTSRLLLVVIEIINLIFWFSLYRDKK
jgi:uncharacterized membrane protein YbhN (UPF0104 family)